MRLKSLIDSIFSCSGNLTISIICCKPKFWHFRLQPQNNRAIQYAELVCQKIAEIYFIWVYSLLMPTKKPSKSSLEFLSSSEFVYSESSLYKIYVLQVFHILKKNDCYNICPIFFYYFYSRTISSHSFWGYWRLH